MNNFKGSGWLWIYNKDCRGKLNSDCKKAVGHKVYSYSDRTVIGPVATTTLTFKDLETGKEIKSDNHPLIVAKSHTRLMNERLIGLSLSHDNTYNNFMGT